MLAENCNTTEAVRLDDPGLFRQASYVDGAWVGAMGGAALVVTNPADLTLIGDAPAMTGRDARLAVDAAQSAFGDWSGRLPQDRARILRRWFDLMLVIL